MSTPKPASTLGNFLFSIDGAEPSLIKSFDGGTLKAKKISEHGGPNLLKKHKHGNIEYKDVSIEASLAQAGPFLDWVQCFMAAAPVAKTAIVYACNQSFESQAERSLIGLWIKKMAGIEVDADKDESLYSKLDFVVNSCDHTKGSGRKVTGKLGPKQRLMSASAFKLEIGGMPCDFVSKVTAPGMEQKFTKVRCGGLRGYENIPGTVEITDDLKFTMPVSRGYDEWAKYADSYLKLGNQGNETMMTGALTLFANDQKTEVAELQFEGLSLNEITLAKLEGGSEKAATCEVSMACEAMKLILKQKDA